VLVFSKRVVVSRWVCAGWLVMCVFYGSLVAEDVTSGSAPEPVQQNLESKQGAKEKGANLLVVGKHLVEWKPYSVNIISLCTAIFTIGGVICKMISNRKDSKTRAIFSQTEKSTECVQDMAVQTEKSVECVQDMAVQTELISGEGLLFDEVSSCHERPICNRCYRETDLYHDSKLEETYNRELEELQERAKFLVERKNQLFRRRQGVGNDKQVGGSRDSQ